MESYQVKTQAFPARPRSKRRREEGTSWKGTGVSLSGMGHTHPNKDVLDQITEVMLSFWHYDAENKVVFLGDAENPVSLAVFGEVTAGGIGSGGGGGSNVTWEQILTTGTPIARITIGNQTPITVYAPAGGGGASSFAQLTGSPYDNVALSSALGQKYDASNPAGYITSSGSVAKVKGNNSSYDLYSLTYVAGHNYPYGERIYSDGFCVPNNAGILDGNIGVIRMGWEVAPYYHDILWSPNTSDIWHRSAATASSPWRKIWDSVNLTDNSQLANGAGYITEAKYTLIQDALSVDEPASSYRYNAMECRVVYGNGFPAQYGHTLTIRHAWGGATQLFMSWNSGQTADNPDVPQDMWIRGQRDIVPDWSTWTKLITDRNIASQSVAKANYADVLRDPDYHTTSSRRTSANISWADGGLHYYLATSSMTEGKPNGDGHILHLAWDNGSWEGQISVPTSASASPQWRTMDGSTWSSWKTFYHSDNANNTSTPWSANTLNVGSGGIMFATNGESFDKYGNFFLSAGSTSWGVYTHNGARLLYIDAITKNVGIGTTTPAYKCDINGSLQASEIVFANTLSTLANPYTHFRVGRFDEQGGIKLQFGNTTNATIQVINSVWSLCLFKMDTGGNFSATGEITAGAASDARFKDNQSDLRNANRVLKALRPVEFEWNDFYHSLGGGNEGHDVGFLAQEVQGLIPSAISKVYGDYLRLDYNKVTPYLVAGWQMHETEIDRLRRRVAYLEKQLNIN